jgi:hypothetical protein
MTIAPLGAVWPGSALSWTAPRAPQGWLGIDTRFGGSIGEHAGYAAIPSVMNRTCDLKRVTPLSPTPIICICPVATRRRGPTTATVRAATTIKYPPRDLLGSWLKRAELKPSFTIDIPSGRYSEPFSRGRYEASPYLSAKRTFEKNPLDAWLALEAWRCEQLGGTRA